MSKDTEKLIDGITKLVKITKNQGKMITSLNEEVESLKGRTTKLEKRTKERIF